MSQHRVSSAEFQVHCLGSSADLGALRRSLEARGMVSRARLTPAVQAVVADHTVADDHPVLAAARELGIEILDPSQAVDRLLSRRSSRRHAAAVPVGRTSTRPPSRLPTIAIVVLALVGALVMLGVVGALVQPDAAPPRAPEPVNEMVRNDPAEAGNPVEPATGVHQGVVSVRPVKPVPINGKQRKH